MRYMKNKLPGVTQNNMRTLLFLISAILPLSVFAKAVTVESHIFSSEKLIDGSTNDWDKAFIRLENNDAVQVASVHNDSALSICIISSDRDLNRQIMMSGFNVQFSGVQKGKKAVLGVRFPIGMQADRSSKSGSPESNRDPEARKALESQMLQSLIVFGPQTKNEYPMSHNVADSFGIRVACGSAGDTLVYELQLPLSKGSPVTDSIAIVNPKGIVQVAIETIEPKMPQGGQSGNKPPQGGGGMPPGGGGSGSGGPGGAPPGGQGGMQPPSFEQFSVDLQIKLFTN